MRTLAEDLIAEADKSPEHHAWISRQLMAQRKPSEILAELRRAVAPKRLLSAAGGDGPVGLTVACIIMFALPFFALGFLLPA